MAASSVGVMYRVSGPNTGSNPGGGQILKKNIEFYFTLDDRITTVSTGMGLLFRGI